MTISSIRLWIVICLLIFAVPVRGDESGLDKTIRVGIFPFNPINYIDKDGSAKGLNPDLLREMFRDETLRLAFVPGSWAEGLQRLQDEEIDLMMSVAYNEERAKVMDYGRESVLQLWGQVFAKPDSHSKNISDLFNQKVGVMHRDISGENFIATVERLGGSCGIVEYATHDEVFQAVQNGEVDAGVAPQHFGLRHANAYDLIGTSILFSPFSIYFTAKKGLGGEVLSNIDSHLTRWKNDEASSYYEILNKWMAPAASQKGIAAWLLPAFFIVLSATLISLCFIFLLNSAVRRKTRALKESETRFKDVTLNISDWIWEVDMYGIYTYCSEHSHELLDYTPEEVVGKSYYDFLPPEDVERIRNAFQEIIQSGKAFRNRELTCIRKDGNRIELQASAVPIVAESGEILGYRGVVSDITEKKQAEAERLALENRLAHAQKMEAIGTLAGGIAHDFNNLLAAILGYTELALDNCSQDSKTAQDLNAINEAGTRAKELVKQILTFSRQGELSNISVQPANIIKEAVKMLRPSLPTTIEIRQNIEHSDDSVLADPSKLNQIIINICTNAFHAMEEKGGYLDIAMKSVVLSREDLTNEPHISPGSFIDLSVADSGAGIAPEIRDKIFDPYFTTKEMGKGTGMGLSIVHGIVKSYGGFVTCSSQPGEGSVFHVYLPVQEREKIPVIENDGRTPTGSERILFVDDEVMIVEMNKLLLEGLGYTVLPMTGSREALQLFLKTPEQFDLVITDQTMPNMTGAELASELFQIRPELPIILCTGYSTIMTKEKARTMGIREFAIKPLVKKEIAGLIRKVLDNNNSKQTACV